MKARRIEVSYQGQVVGELATNGLQTLFQYDREWLLSGHELSPLVMSRRQKPYPGTLKELHYLPPLFSDSLPDRYGMRIMSRWFAEKNGPTFAPTPVDCLSYVGETGMGALVYHPVAHSLPPQQLRQLDLRSQERLVQAIEAAGMPEPAYLEQARRAAHTVGGAYPKILCAEDPETGLLYEDDPRIERNYRRWIVKLAQDRRPFASEIELGLNRLARAAGMLVPETKLMVSEGEQAGRQIHFAIERFDLVSGDRLHFLSLAGVTGRPAADLTLDYRDLLATTRELTRDMSQVAEAFRRMVFNVLVWNTDDHAKNHGFLYQEGTWRISPAYDITHCPGTPGAPAIRAMPIWGKSSDLTLAQLLSAGASAGLSNARQLADEVLTTAREASRVFTDNGLDVEQLESVLTSIKIQVERFSQRKRK